MLNLSLTTPNTNLIEINGLTSRTSARNNNFAVLITRKNARLREHTPELVLVCKHLSVSVQMMDSEDVLELSPLQFAVAHPQLNSQYIWSAHLKCTAIQLPN